MFEKGPLDGTFFCFKKVLLSMKSETSLSFEKVPFWNVKNPNLKKVPFFSTKLQQKKNLPIRVYSKKGTYCFSLERKSLFVKRGMKSETSISSEKKQQYYVQLKHPYTETNANPLCLPFGKIFNVCSALTEEGDSVVNIVNFTFS